MPMSHWCFIPQYGGCLLLLVVFLCLVGKDFNGMWRIVQPPGDRRVAVNARGWNAYNDLTDNNIADEFLSSGT
jgi:hypothetical protein